MPHLPTILVALLLCAAPIHAQTLKSLMFNSTNGQVVANTGTNVLKFSNSVTINVGNGSMQFRINNDGVSIYSGAVGDDILVLPNDAPPVFATAYYWTDPSVRAAVGFSTNLNTLWTATNASSARSAVGLGATWLTNTNVTNFRTAIGLGATNSATFQAVTTEVMAVGAGTNSYFSADMNMVETALPIEFANNSAATTRTNLGLSLAALTNTSNVTMMRALAGSTNTNEPVTTSINFLGHGNETFVMEVVNGIITKVYEQ